MSGNILVHGLINCNNCFNVWNKYVNGATNIYIELLKMQPMD
jgi:hypothetical protein